MRYDRVLAIPERHDRLIRLIRSGKFSSVDLAEKLNVSEQTIYRDIDFLKGRGYSILAVRRAKAWAYTFSSEPDSVPNRKGTSQR